MPDWMIDWLIVGELKSEWQVVCQCPSKYPWIHLIVGAPIKGLIQDTEKDSVTWLPVFCCKSTKMVPISEAKIAKKSSILALFN